LQAVLGETVPVLSADVSDSDKRFRLGQWPVAMENRRSSLAAVSMVLNRLIHLCLCTVQAITEASSPREARLALSGEPLAEGNISPPQSTAQAAFLLRALAQRIVTRLQILAGHRDDWRVIWRFRDHATALDAPEADATPFHSLPDDGRRFYADPFPHSFGGKTALFVEELPYATGKGVISVCEIGQEGPIGSPRPVLEQECHLSYPHVFEHEGTVWMIPETGGRRTVELWRADRFPDRWVQHAVLVEDMEIYDATPVAIGGQWIMFGAVREPGCSSWDALAIWTAPALTGPWALHQPSPALVDVSRARPAGRVRTLPDGSCLRPVQNSSLHYGESLALARPVFDSAGEFRETVERRLLPPAPLRGLHTWNQTRHGARILETMDVFGPSHVFEQPRSLNFSGKRA
jgi:hypothetical protein